MKYKRNRKKLNPARGKQFVVNILKELLENIVDVK